MTAHLAPCLPTLRASSWVSSFQPGLVQAPLSRMARRNKPLKQLIFLHQCVQYIALSRVESFTHYLGKRGHGEVGAAPAAGRLPEDGHLVIRIIMTMILMIMMMMMMTG